MYVKMKLFVHIYVAGDIGVAEVEMSSELNEMGCDGGNETCDDI